MRRRVTLWLLSAPLAGALLGRSLEAPQVDDADLREPPECIEYSGFTQYGAIGYDHIIYVHNQCDERATCAVSTNIDPTPIRIELAPGEHQEVVTRRGSPAREFEPHLRCAMHSD